MKIQNNVDEDLLFSLVWGQMSNFSFLGLELESLGTAEITDWIGMEFVVCFHASCSGRVDLTDFDDPMHALYCSFN